LTGGVPYGGATLSGSFPSGPPREADEGGHKEGGGGSSFSPSAGEPFDRLRAVSFSNGAGVRGS